MNLFKQSCLGLLAFQLALDLQSQPILVQPQNQGFGGSSLSNLRLRNLSADGTEAILTVEFNYDGVNGPGARILPVIREKKQPNVSGWFGADPVPVSTGRGIISLRVKFFSDEPGVPPQLTTDHVKVIMLSDSGNTIISQGLFATTIKWGNTNAQPARPSPPKIQEQAPLQAQAGEKASQEARLMAEAEAKSRQEARLKAEADELARQQAVAKQLAEEKAKAEADAKAREEARLKAQADEQARQMAEAKRLAEEKAKAEAEAKAAEETRLKAEAQEKARQESEARRLAEEKAKAEAETRRAAAEKAGAASPTAQAAPAATPAPFALSSTARTKVINIDVVNRNIDRTEMTIGVEYKYAKEDGQAEMGVDIASTEEPRAAAYFSSAPARIGRGSRNFLMFPVKVNAAAAAQDLRRATLPTDKVRIYLAAPGGAKSYVFEATMLLVWQLPGGATASAPEPAGQNIIDIDTFKQNDLFNGCVTVRYDMAARGGGKLRLRVYDSAQPATADWFASDDVTINSGPGLGLLKVSVPKEAPSPDLFNADTIEVQMLDSNGAVVASVKKQSAMSWAKPK
jgi:hypothetical protein